MVFKNVIYNFLVTIIHAKKIWVKWKARNRFELDTSFFSNQHSHPNPNPKSTCLISWAKPSRGFIKINFDGSKSSSSAAGGYVIRSWDGRFLQARTSNLGATTVLVVEATAMWNDVRATVLA